MVSLSPAWPYRHRAKKRVRGEGRVRGSADLPKVCFVAVEWIAV
jgi:hypothetical protein